MNLSEPIANDALTKQDDMNENVIDLEKKLRSLRSKEDLQAGFVELEAKDKWKTAALIIPLMVLAILPPLFIVFDRWLAVNQLKNFPREEWCRVDFLCRSALPAYFAWIFYLLALIAIMMLFFAPSIFEKIEAHFRPSGAIKNSQAINQGNLQLRNRIFLIASIGLAIELLYCFLLKRIPGMELLIIVFAYLAAILVGENENAMQMVSIWFTRIKKNAVLYATLFFSQVALVLFLEEMATFRQHPWIYYFLLAAAASAVFIHRKRIHKVYWIFTLALILFTFQMNSWKFAFIGDEYSFYYYPNEFISKQSFFGIMDYFFNIKGVYDIVPYFSSLITYIFMLFLGPDHFGWHLSQILMLALMIPLFYDFLKSFVNDRIAFLSVIPLAFSHYLVNFSKIGYTNLQALFMMVLILWVAGKAVKRKTFSLYFLLGICLGFCFYTYPLAIYAIPLVGLFLLLVQPIRSKTVWLWYLVVLLGLILMLIPIFFQPEYWSNMSGRTVFYINHGSILANSSTQDLLERFFYNLLYIPFVYLYLPGEYNYVVSSLIDPVMSVFIPIGFILLLLNFRRNRFLIFLALAFVVEALVISISNPYDSPPITRMFLFMPFYYVFAILGMDWVIRAIAGLSTRPRIFYYGAITCLLIAACLFNMLLSTVILENRLERYPIESTILRLFQHDALEDPKNSKTYLFLTEEDFAIYFYNTFQDVYGVPESKTQLQQVVVESGQIPDVWQQRMKEEDDLVIIIPYSVPDSVISAMKPILEQTGKKVCEVTDTVRNTRYYQMWYSDKYPNLCEEAVSQDNS